MDVELEKFRDLLTKDWGRTWDDGKTLPAASRLSSIVIACRHGATPSKNHRPLHAYDVLRVASEVTGIPLEQMRDTKGRRVTVWRPARGEVGWLPYDVPSQNWTGGDWKWDNLTQDWFQTGRAITTAPVGA